MTPPAARVEVTRDTYFGTTIEDPYRWLEARESDEAQGGHGQGTAEQEEERLADKLAFLMHHLRGAIEA